MAGPTKFFMSVARRPLEAIETILALSLFFSGIWLIVPKYHTEVSLAAKISGSATIALCLGIFQILLALPLFYALAKTAWPVRQAVRRATTFIVFLLYLFYGFSQAMLYGMKNPHWIGTFALALIAGAAHLRLKWELLE